MLFEAGTIIGGSERGESGTDTTDESIIRNASGNPRGPEIIGGFEAEEPRTERITSDSGGTGNPKLYQVQEESTEEPSEAKRGTSEATTQKSNGLGSVGFDKLLDLTEVIFSGHQMLAGFISELELDKDESERLSKAVKDVGQYYGATFDPKKVAIFNLCMVAGSIYGLRFAAIFNRVRNSQPKPVQQAAGPRPVPQRTQPVNGAQQPVAAKASEPIPPNIPGWGMENGTL